ncbi:MAG: hypothetical protein J6V23_07065 [Bacteroidaceae bacterium]|nr:hypothetical protein [Bacteroidaceae bacterium]
MSIVNKVKGFVRTIIGIPPLTLPNCVDEDSLINYKIYGDSLQDGTPTPDNPIEVVSVGEKTKNLLDISTAENKTVQGVELSIDHATQKIKAKGVATNSGGRLFYLTQITLPAGTYYFSSNTELPRAGLTNVNSTSSVVAWCNRAFTLTETTTLGLGFNVIAGTEYDVEVLLQITEGDSPKEYEPFGYKIPVIAKGNEKNLANPQCVHDYVSRMNALGNENNYAGNDTQIFTDENGRKIFKLNGKSGHYHENKSELEKIFTGIFKEKTAYTLSFDFYRSQSTTSMNLGVRFTDGTEGVLSNENFSGVSQVEAGKIYHFTCRIWVNGKTIEAIKKVYHGGDTYIYMDTIQIEEGTTETDYEPYVEPITTNIYLDEPLASGEVISYPKDNVPRLPTFKGTTIYEVDTSVQPSNMEVTYYSTQKGE